VSANKIKAANIDPVELVARIKTKGPAPVHLWDPPFCGDMDMRIAKDGIWYHQDRPIRRPTMVRLFASILRLDDDGEYYLVTPIEKVRIQVEDCPYVIIAMEVEGGGSSQNLQFETNTGEVFIAGAEHGICIEVDELTAEPHPFVHVRSGLNGLINRAVFYRLVELVECKLGDAGSEQGVWSGGEFFKLAGL
jgi:hypothetical protein